MTGPPHGTYTRYQSEVIDGLTPCDACKAANRDRMARHRARTSTKCSKGLGWPLRDPRITR